MVEDDPAARRLTSYLLATNGHVRVYQAADAAEFGRVFTPPVIQTWS